MAHDIEVAVRGEILLALHIASNLTSAWKDWQLMAFWTLARYCLRRKRPTSLLREDINAIGLGQTALMMKGYIPAPSSAGSSCCISVPSKGSCCFCPGCHPGLGEPTDLQQAICLLLSGCAML